MGFASVKESSGDFRDLKTDSKRFSCFFELFIGIFAKNYAVREWGWHLGTGVDRRRPGSMAA